MAAGSGIMQNVMQCLISDAEMIILAHKQNSKTNEL